MYKFIVESMRPQVNFTDSIINLQKKKKRIKKKQENDILTLLTGFVITVPAVIGWYSVIRTSTVPLTKTNSSKV
jgi:hypothetical protein